MGKHKVNFIVLIKEAVKEKHRKCWHQILGKLVVRLSDLVIYIYSPILGTQLEIYIFIVIYLKKNKYCLP